MHFNHWSMWAAVLIASSPLMALAESHAGPSGSVVGSARPQVPVYGSYVAAFGNGSLDRAQVVLLCQQPGNPLDTFNTNTFLSEQSRDGDTILVDGLAAGQTRSQNEVAATKGLSQSLNVKGWDDLTMLANVEKGKAVWRGVLYKYQTDKLNGDQEAMSQDKARLVSIGSALEKVMIEGRNQSMLSTLAKEDSYASVKSKRVFVVMGCPNMMKDKGLKDAMGGYQYVALLPRDALTNPSVPPTPAPAGANRSVATGK